MTTKQLEQKITFVGTVSYGRWAYEVEKRGKRVRVEITDSEVKDMLDWPDSKPINYTYKQALKYIWDKA